jgi:hypothetical protein
MTTINSVGVSLNGQTGTGEFVGSISPVFSQISFSTTTSGIIATATNDNAAAGIVGEFMSSVVPFASSVSLTTSVSTNVTFLTLTPGDWDVWGNIFFTATTTNASTQSAWISATSATTPDRSLLNQIVPEAGQGGMCAPGIRFSLSVTTPVYLTAFAAFSNTCTACGGIYARRAR